MILVGRLLGGLVALALLGHRVDQHRAVEVAFAHILQDGQQVVEVMPVDWPDVVETHFLEESTAGQHATGELIGPCGRRLDRSRKVAGDFLAKMSQTLEGTGRQELGEIRAHGADRRRDRHVVVVEDDDESAVARAGVVHRLIGHSGRHGTVADHGNNVVVFPFQIARHGKTQSGRDRGRGMCRAKWIVFAFLTAGEAGQATALTQGANAIAAAGEDLVRIALMADIPDQNVVGGIESIVDRHCQLDHAETGSEMTSGHGDSVDQFCPQLIRQLPELGRLQLA